MKTSHVTVKTTSKTKKLSENKREEQLNQLKETLWKRKNEIQAERQVRKGRGQLSYLTGTLMDKSSDWPSVNSKTAGGAEEAIGVASKLADKTGKQRKGEDLDGRDEALKSSSEGS